MPDSPTPSRSASPALVDVSGPAADSWRRAIARVCDDPGALSVAFQPIIDLKRGVTCGFEALTRPHGPPDAGPAHWCAAAAALGLGARLEARMLGAALAHRDALPPNCFLSVNIAPGPLIAEPAREVLADAGRLEGIVLELTGRHQEAENDALVVVLRELHDRGVRVAIDDVDIHDARFGEFATLEPDFVKLDRGLIAGLDVDPRRAAVVETLGALASRLNAWVIAEGIEREPELHALADLRVPLGQGFLLARPQPRMDRRPVALGHRLRTRAALRAQVGAAGALVEWVQPARAGAVDRDGDGATGDDDDRRHLPVVDTRGRPTGLLEHRDGRMHRLRVLAVLPTEPVHTIAARAIARPAAERLAPLLCCDERGRYLGLVRVERIVEELARQGEQMARTLAVQAERAEVAAMTDALTGIPNRRRWDALIAAEDARCERYGRAAAVLIFDLDQLKTINDAEGHFAGDDLIQRAARVLEATARPFDSVARIGGDEFGVLAVEADAVTAETLHRRMIAALDEAAVSASSGIGVRGRDGALAEAWDAADRAMYETKARRRSRTPRSATVGRPLGARPTGPDQRR